MLRTAMKPRWLGLLALVVVVMVTFTILGLWQLDVARDKGRAEAVKAAPTRPTVALSRVVAPHADFPADGSGRPVSTTGRYDVTGQVLVTPRVLNGRTGYWVVTPLVVKDTGARLAVVRGFVTEAAQATPPAVTGPVTVNGTLAPGESPSTGAALPAGQLGSVDLSLLVNRWHGEIYNAFLFATGESPEATRTAGSAIERVPPPRLPSNGLSWRNAAYALQWWVFALFAAYMWWRMVRDDHEGRSGTVDHLRTDLSERATHV